MSSGSTVLSRWAVPLIVIWAQILLSAWVFTERLPPHAQKLNLGNLAVLAGAPLASLVFLLIGRALSRRDKDPTRSGDYVLVWGLVFLFALHAAVLAVVMGVLKSLNEAVPFGVAGLLFGLGVLFLLLEPGSAMGIRTQSTLQNEVSWRRAHRAAALLMVAAAAMAAAAWFVTGPLRLVAAGAPAVGAVLLAVLYASRLPKVAETPAKPAEGEE